MKNCEIHKKCENMAYCSKCSSEYCYVCAEKMSPPNKPTTLREEFYKQYGYNNQGDSFGYDDLAPKEIADWWLDKFDSHSTELLSKLEGMKATEVEVLKDLTGCAKVHNQALNDVISLINQEK